MPDETPTRSAVVAVQLVLVRSLFDRARLAVQESNDVGLMTALLLADVGCETLVKIVLVDRGAEMKPTENIHELVGKLATAVPALADVPALQNARRLRVARNPVQHAGAAPSMATVSNHLADARAFAQVVVKEAFGVDFERISSASLVSTPDLRHGLEQAGGNLALGKLEDANMWATATFDMTIARWEGWTIRAFADIPPHVERAIPIHINYAVIKTFRKEQPEIWARLYPDSLWRGDWTFLSMGFSPVEVLRIRRLRKRADKYAEHGPESVQDLPPLDPAELAFFVEVLAREVWRIESTQPEMLRRLDLAPVPGGKPEP